MNGMIGIMAKVPEPGRVKTRLCPPLSLSTAADLALCFLCDTIDRVRRFGASERAIIYTPEGAGDLFAKIAPDFIPFAQRGADLGARLVSAFEDLFRWRDQPVLIIGTDTPTLPLDIFGQAFDRLADSKTDVVLGPAEDGGYYMIGLRRLHRSLFDRISWSSPRVFRDTVRRAQAAALSVALLPQWFDIDTADDLDRLARTLSRGSPHEASNTVRYLQTLGPLKRNSRTRTGSRTTS
jgi:rSAM/selenodomain-associated transferase 1